MKTFPRFLAMVAGLGLAVSSMGATAATECNTGPPPAAIPLSGTLTGGVVVNAGDFCILGGANVYGGVRVNQGGILILCGSTINGGLESNGAVELVVGAEEIGCDGSTIHGGVRISNTGPGNVLPPGCTPDVDCAPSLAVENSIIDGSVRLVGNLGTMAIAGNNIRGGLFCKNNQFDPEDEGNPSVVTGEVSCEFEP